MARLIVVEDEPLIAIMLADWLAELGHEVAGTAGRTDEALSLISRTSPDAAIVDLLLVDGESYAVADDLKGRSIPFLVMTGATVEEEQTSLDGVDVLTKPVEFERLAEAVTRLVFSRRAIALEENRRSTERLTSNQLRAARRPLGTA